MYMLLIEGGNLSQDKGTNSLRCERESSQILTLLKKQDGFIDEFLTFEEGTQKGCGLAFWSSREQAQHYQREVFRKRRITFST